MCYEGTAELIRTYISIASSHFGLGIYLNDTCKYVLDNDGRIVAKVHWTRSTYCKGSRSFDTFKDNMQVQLNSRSMDIEVMNTDNNQLIVDFITLVWQGSYTSIMEHFKPSGSYLTDCMIREIYDADIKYVKEIS